MNKITFKELEKVRTDLAKDIRLLNIVFSCITIVGLIIITLLWGRL